jgi:hypothetical protein
LLAALAGCRSLPPPAPAGVPASGERPGAGTTAAYDGFKSQSTTVETTKSTTVLDRTSGGCEAGARDAVIGRLQAEALEACSNGGGSRCKVLQAEPVPSADPKTCTFVVVVQRTVGGALSSAPPNEAERACIRSGKDRLAALGPPYTAFVKDWDAEVELARFEKGFLSCAGGTAAAAPNGAGPELTFFHEGMHLLGSAPQLLESKGDSSAGAVTPLETYRLYRPGAAPLVLRHVPGTISAHVLADGLETAPFLGRRVDTYFGHDEGRDFFLLLDEWNAYVWMARAGQAVIARSGCGQAESDTANGPLEFAYFLERYLERQRQDGPDVFRLLLAQDSVRAALRALIADTRVHLTPDPRFACLGNAQLPALRAAAAASLDRLAAVASSSR